MSRVLSILLLLALAGCEEKLAAPPRPVLSVVVEAQHEERRGRFAGTIQARHETVLGFRVGGRIARRWVDVGDRVAPGTLLAELDPVEQHNLLRARESELAEVRARYDNARAIANRQQQLFASSIGSKSQLEQLRTEASTLAAALEQARSAARLARDQLSYSRLYGDHDGVVTAWHAEAGQTVAAGQDVLTLAQSQVREAVFDLPAGLAERLPAEAHWQVSAELAPQLSTTGRIRELAPQADASTRTRRVRLSLEQTPEAFRLGSTISVELSVPVARRSLLPASALFERAGKDQVWVIDPERLTVAPRAVQVLAREGGRVTIGEGLEPGERVVAAGVNSLEAGQAVTLDEEAR
ncbi:Multidrug resistance protein MdtA [compost metagenome]